MLVDPSNLNEVFRKLDSARQISIDTETDGLYSWQDNKLFAITCATDTEEFYFSRDSFADSPWGLAGFFNPFFVTFGKVVHMLNAKFDMAFLYKEGVRFPDNGATIIDVQVTARLLQSDLLTTSMAALAPWVGQAKDKNLEKWARENGAWEWEQHEDGTRSRRILFHKIPLEIICPYAEKDARITFDLGVFILQQLKLMDQEREDYQPSVLECLNTEIKITKVLFAMECEGVLANKAYIQAAFTYETRRWKEAAEEFKLLTGTEFKNSGKTLGAAFEKFAQEDAKRFQYTPTNQFCTKDEVFRDFTSPLAGIVKEYRDAYKRAGTYFANYEALLDHTHRIHASFRQGGPRTGRLSCGSPNLQNVTKGKDKTSEYPIRRCFVTPQDYYWVSLDYDQLEYRMMLDYAGEMELIELVLGGLDVHQATANLMGVERDPAKTINFMLLYGGGVAKLASALKISMNEARELRALYFAKLPKVSALIRAITQKAELSQKVFNWHGRVSRFPDPKYSYKAPNYLIQGGCADVVKVAMVNVADHLKKNGCLSKLVLQVHDELDLYIHKDELHLVPEIKRLMETAYPHKHLPLTVSTEISEASWADLGDFEEWTSRQKLLLP